MAPCGIAGTVSMRRRLSLLSTARPSMFFTLIGNEETDPCPAMSTASRAWPPQVDGCVDCHGHAVIHVFNNPHFLFIFSLQS